MHCNLRAALHRASRSWMFVAKCVLRMRTDTYFSASDQNSDIAIRSSDPDFAKKEHTIIWRSDDVFTP